MKAIYGIRKSVVTATPDTTVTEVAALMDRENVGSVLVLDGRRLVGIVTDRDIVRRAVARQLPPDARVDAVMTTEVFTLDADADRRAALPIFRHHECRRVPLMSGEDVVGVLSVDDFLIDLVNDLADVVRPITGEVVFGQQEEPLPELARTHR